MNVIVAVAVTLTKVTMEFLVELMGCVGG